MNKNTYILLFSLLIAAHIAIAQDIKLLEKASEHFLNYDYQNAIEVYEKVETKPKSVKRTLVDAYLKIHDFEKAEVISSELVKSENAKAEDFLKHFEIMKHLEKYDEAEKAITKFHLLEKKDKRALQHISNKGYYNQLKDDKGQFELEELDFNSKYDDFSPVFYGESLAFSSSRKSSRIFVRQWVGNKQPYLDVYTVDLPKDSSESKVKKFSKVNKKYHEGPISFSEDGNFMVFTRNNYDEKSEEGVLNLELYESELVDGKWAKAKAFTHNHKDHSLGHPSLSKDGRLMYFASDMPGGYGGFDLYVIERNTDGTWGKPQNLGEKINTEGHEVFPFLHKDKEMLFFASDGKPGLGGLDVFLAQVKNKQVHSVENLGFPVNTSKDDFGFILDQKQKKGYFSSNRPGGKGGDDIYGFNLKIPFKFGTIIQGVIAKKEGQKPLDNALVILKDSKDNVLDSLRTNSKGEYQFMVEPDNIYKLSTRKHQYDKASDNIIVKDEDKLKKDFYLSKIFNVSLLCLVKDKESQEALEDVTMQITNNFTGKSFTVKTDDKGSYLKAIEGLKKGDRLSFNISLEKESYISKTVTYNTEINKEGIYDVSQALNLDMFKPEVGKDLKEIIDINPIYFDLGKYAIRTDAAIELDKIVKIMNENPNMVVELGSHTDSRGSTASNKRLSDKRAKASANYIKKKITTPSRIYGKGYGESRLINKCKNGVKCSEEEHELNRRTEFIIKKF